MRNAKRRLGLTSCWLPGDYGYLLGEVWLVRSDVIGGVVGV